jgi:hypothetical protein
MQFWEGERTRLAVELTSTVSPPDATSLRYMMRVAMRSLPSCGCHHSSRKSVCAAVRAHGGCQIRHSCQPSTAAEEHAHAHLCELH